MNKKYITIIVVLIGVLGVGAVILSKKDTAPGASRGNNQPMSANMDTPSSSNNDKQSVMDLTSQSQVKMDIKDYKFSKPNIKIKKGTTVTWTNQDTVKHNVILDHPSSIPHGAPSKEEVKPNVFAGPLLAKGESYSFTFNEVTDNPYHCSPHPYMKGKVTVVE